ncbi:hypothetical protein LCGC14_1432860 [marine sediment metagenome]|uniref:Uncharacterized protein n=1 Tax=marine sediment metagenome TaxID=412755 RepID=A0A0F9K990_9ZZZZ
MIKLPFVPWYIEHGDGQPMTFIGADGKELPGEWEEIDVEETKGWSHHIGFSTTKITDD